MRAAYRKKGWAFTDPQQIDQCAKEGYVTKLKEQEGEGCHMWGSLQINKVTNPAQNCGCRRRPDDCKPECSALTGRDAETMKGRGIIRAASHLALLISMISSLILTDLEC